MADFGGFQVQTPQEVLAQLMQQRQKVMTQGNVHQQRSQNVETALDVIFGNPQMRQAKRLEGRMQAAQQVAKVDGEDQLDYELRRLSAMRDAVADVDPSVAAQINARLLELGEAKFQRSRLVANDAREKAKFDLDIKDAQRKDLIAEKVGGTSYVLTPDGNVEAFNLLDEQQTPAFTKAAQKKGAQVITPDQAFNLFLQNDAQAAAMQRALIEANRKAAGGSKVTLKDAQRASGALLGLYSTADRIFQILESNPDALTSTSAGAKKLDALATELGATGRAATGQKLKDSDLTIDDWFKQNSIQNTRMQGLVIGLAYSMAKANDPAGRISDKDLVAAVAMVGGDNPNPAAILSNLNDNLTVRTTQLVKELETLDPETKEAMAERLAVINKDHAAFTNRFRKFAGGAAGEAATGIAPAADKDGWTTVNGVRVRVKPQ